MLAFALNISFWMVLMGVTVISLWFVLFWRYKEGYRGNFYSFPNFSPLFAFVVWFICNLIMWLIYFIVVCLILKGQT